MQTAAGQTEKHWTFKAFVDGVAMTLPVMPGIFVFGMAFGTVAARKDFSLLDTIVMSGTVFAGMAQFVVLEVWPREFTVAATAASALVVGMVCLRFLLIGASLRPWLGGTSPAKIYPTLYLLTDSSWIVALRYRAKGGSDPAFLLGSGVLTWVTWVLSAAPGYWLGASLADPQRYGLDLVMPVFFVAMMVPIWRGVKLAIGWLVAAAVSLATYHYLGGWWYVPLGAIAGSVVGGLLHDKQ